MSDIVERLREDAASTATQLSTCGIDVQPTDMLAGEAAALIASQRERIEELEKGVADVATRIDRQVKASDGYAEEYARKDEARPTVWQIGNSHFTDLARELRSLLNRTGEG